MRRKNNRCIGDIHIRVLLVILLLSSCTSIPNAQNSAGISAQESAPLWIMEPGKAYPASTWIVAVDSASTKAVAQSLALSSLASTFKINVKGMADATESFENINSDAGSKFSDSMSFIQNVKTATDVNGLIGVESESFTAKNGTVYVCARMNIPECSKRYSGMIKENDSVIKELIADAQKEKPGFTAYEYLRTALALATITDNYQAILEVLDSSAASRKPGYGSAERVKKLAQDMSRKIVITIQVDGDDTGEINRAFATYFKSRGFSTNLQSGMYLCYATFTTEEVETKTKFKSVRYTINMTLTDVDGNEVFAFTNEGRQNHNSVSEAEKRAILAARDSIAKANQKGGFGQEFDKYLASLL